jgi:hypothetical protein
VQLEGPCFECFEGLKHCIFYSSAIMGEVTVKPIRGLVKVHLRGVNNQTVRLQWAGRELLSMVMVPRQALLSPAQKQGNWRVSVASAFRLGGGRLSLL